MKFCTSLVVLATLAAFCSAEKGKNSSTTVVAINTTAVSSPDASSVISTSSMPYSSSQFSSPNISMSIHPNTSHTVISGNSSSIPHNNTGNMSMTSAHPNNTVTYTPQPVHSTAKVIPSKSTAPTVTPSKSSGSDDSDNMKKRMWVAASFAIIFGITTVILAYLVYRQRRINRELGGDPATSRLL